LNTRKLWLFILEEGEIIRLRKLQKENCIKANEEQSSLQQAMRKYWSDMLLVSRASKGKRKGNTSLYPI
jgi:hypothetical protein